MKCKICNEEYLIPEIPVCNCDPNNPLLNRINFKSKEDKQRCIDFIRDIVNKEREEIVFQLEKIKKLPTDTFKAKGMYKSSELDHNQIIELLINKITNIWK